MRTEFGAERTTCACDACRRCCRFLPAWLIPADIKRMILSDADPFKWAELNLLASPGALVAQVVERLFRSQLEPGKYERRLSRRLFRLPGLVLAAKPDGSCRFLSAQGACTTHDISPFGCAFFDGHARVSPASDRLVRAGLKQSIEVGPRHLYHQLPRHLIRKGLVSPSTQVKRARMRETISQKTEA